MNETKPSKTINDKCNLAKDLLPQNNFVDLSDRKLASQNLLDGINEFSDALFARNDSFYCNRKNIWGDKVSIQTARKPGI